MLVNLVREWRARHVAIHVPSVGTAKLKTFQPVSYTTTSSTTEEDSVGVAVANEGVRAKKKHARFATDDLPVCSPHQKHH